MDFRKLIQSKLVGEDKCHCCSVGTQSGRQCVLAIIEHTNDYGLFIYVPTSPVISKLSDLQLDQVIQVDTTLSFKIASSSPVDSGSVTIKIENLQHSLVFEVRQTDDLSKLLETMKHGKQVYSQNAAFGLPSNFEWMYKYFGSTTSTGKSSDLFAATIFDPLATNDKLSEWPYNLITQPDVSVVAVDVGLVPPPAENLAPSIKKNRSFQEVSSLAGVTDVADGARKSSDALKRANDVVDPLSRVQLFDAPRGRDAIVRLKMRDRQDEYTKKRTYKVLCGTYNVNGQSPPGDLRAWLYQLENGGPPDIYAIGFQELDLSKNAYIFAASPREDEWFNKVTDSLHPSAKYEKLKLIRLVGIMLIVYVRVEIRPFVTNVSEKMVGTGLLGVMGNKGGVAVRFNLHDTALCFVNSHLAAHTEEVEGRNQDFRDISNGIRFEPPYSTIGDHDLVFWLGDLNYRIGGIDCDDCKRMIANNQLSELLFNKDQLRQQVKLKRIFLDYKEGDITFAPTYKYDPGSDNWDSSEKSRVPSWCDRILWRGESIRQLSYRSHPTIQVSDHKPVSAVFDLEVKVIDRDLERKVREDVMKLMDQRENDFLPQVTLDKTEVRFDKVKFFELQQQAVVLTNTGQTSVEFVFIKKLSDVHYCKPWLTVSPSHGFLGINEKTTIQLEVYVDTKTAPLLNVGTEKIEDILVLHLEGGKDLFISISGSYLPSCFGSSIESLVRQFSPIRPESSNSLTNTNQKGPAESMSAEQDKPFDIPKELWRLVDCIYQNGLDEILNNHSVRGPEMKLIHIISSADQQLLSACETIDELFNLPGSYSEMLQIRDALDTGFPSALPGSPHSVAKTLLILFEAFAEPVIPYKYYSQCLEASNNFTLCKQVLSNIPKSHRNVFKYICAFLRKLLQHSAANKLEINFLAAIFGSVLLREPPRDSIVGGVQQVNALPASSSKAREDSHKRARFVHTFLINNYDE